MPERAATPAATMGDDDAWGANRGGASGAGGLTRDACARAVRRSLLRTGIRRREPRVIRTPVRLGETGVEVVTVFGARSRGFVLITVLEQESTRASATRVRNCGMKPRNTARTLRGEIRRIRGATKR
jgi:hypothetical protein